MVSPWNGSWSDCSSRTSGTDARRRRWWSPRGAEACCSWCVGLYGTALPGRTKLRTIRGEPLDGGAGDGGAPVWLVRAPDRRALACLRIAVWRGDVGGGVYGW